MLTVKKETYDSFEFHGDGLGELLDLIKQLQDLSRTSGEIGHFDVMVVSKATSSVSDTPPSPPRQRVFPKEDEDEDEFDTDPIFIQKDYCDLKEYLVGDKYKVYRVSVGAPKVTWYRGMTLRYETPTRVWQGFIPATYLNGKKHFGLICDKDGELVENSIFKNYLRDLSKDNTEEINEEDLSATNSD